MFGPPGAPPSFRPRRRTRANHAEMYPQFFGGPPPRHPMHPGLRGSPPGPSAVHGPGGVYDIMMQKVQLIEHYARQRGHNLNQWAHQSNMGPKEFAEALIADLEDAFHNGTPHEGWELVEQLPEWMELEAMEAQEMGDPRFGPGHGGGRAPAGGRMSGREGSPYVGGGFGGQQQPGLARRQEQARQQRRRTFQEIEDILQMQAMQRRGRF
ncbi:MAG: hypothetical protein Q9208_001855 [Pyrenodesmia sp. 3 TL-2023]